MKNAFHRQVDVDQLRDGEFHERKKNALDGFAHPGVFHGRLAHDGGCVNRILAMRDAGEVKDGIEIFDRIKAGEITEGTLGEKLVEMNMSLEHKLRSHTNFQTN